MCIIRKLNGYSTILLRIPGDDLSLNRLRYEKVAITNLKINSRIVRTTLQRFTSDFFMNYLIFSLVSRCQVDVLSMESMVFKLQLNGYEKKMFFLT